MTPLAGKITLVAGGAGEVGEGIVHTFLAQGATVVVPSRSAARLDQLRAAVGPQHAQRLVMIADHIGEVAGAERIRDAVIERFGHLDVVAASLGGWWQGARLIDVPFEVWQQVLDNNLTSHFVAARTFLPLMLDRPGSSYTLIGGAGGERPVPQASPISIAVAGQFMLKRVLAEELRDAQTRINEVIVATPVVTRSRGTQVHPDWVTADEIGGLVAWLASDAGAGIRGETLRIAHRSAIAALQAPVQPSGSSPT